MHIFYYIHIFKCMFFVWNLWNPYRTFISRYWEGSVLNRSRWPPRSYKEGEITPVKPIYFGLCVGKYMAVSENSGFYPQIIHLLIGFSIINHPVVGTTIFGNIHIYSFYTTHYNPIYKSIYKYIVRAHFVVNLITSFKFLLDDSCHKISHSFFDCLQEKVISTDFFSFPT